MSRSLIILNNVRLFGYDRMSEGQGMFEETVCLSCSLVIRALKDVDGERRCFRMVGGVLIERTVKDVLPALQHNCEQVRIFIFV